MSALGDPRTSDASAAPDCQIVTTLRFLPERIVTSGRMRHRCLRPSVAEAEIFEQLLTWWAAVLSADDCATWIVSFAFEFEWLQHLVAGWVPTLPLLVVSSLSPEQLVELGGFCLIGEARSQEIAVVR